MKIDLNSLLNSVVFAAAGIVILILAAWILDKFTPHNLWKEIMEKQNIAAAIAVGCYLLGIAIIIASTHLG
jgi:putative membrane protein